jgi:hypothetical protein
VSNTGKRKARAANKAGSGAKAAPKPRVSKALRKTAWKQERDARRSKLLQSMATKEG